MSSRLCVVSCLIPSHVDLCNLHLLPDKSCDLSHDLLWPIYKSRDVSHDRSQHWYPTPAFPLWITDTITRLGRLPKQDVKSTSYLGITPVRNSRTWTTERHGDLTMTLEQASLSKMTSTSREVKGKGWSKDWRIRYLPETNDTSPKALSNLKCPFDTIPKPKDSVPAEFTENVQHLLSSQDTRAPYTGYYARLNNVLVSVSNVYSVWFEVRIWGNKFECFRLAQNELRLKNHPLPRINFILLKQSREPSQPPSRTEGPSELTIQRPFAGAVAAATALVEKEQRPPTPFDDPSSNEDEYRPKLLRSKNLLKVRRARDDFWRRVNDEGEF